MKERQAFAPEARQISREHLPRLKAILAAAGSVHRAKVRLGTSVEVLEAALSGGKFRPSTLDRLEAAIDRVHR